MIDGLVSVIIPTYNRSNLITETINSVLNQTYQNFEIIIADDGSDDNTEEVISKIKDERILYFKLKHTGIPSIPRNYALKNAKGQFIAFLDSDDLWVNYKLEKQIKIFSMHPQIGVVYCNFEYFGNNHLNNKKFLSKGFSGKIFDKLIYGNFITMLSVICRSEVIQKCGGFDESPGMRAIEDYELWLRFAWNYEFYYMDEVLCKYRIHETNILGSDNLKGHIISFRALCRACNKIGVPNQVFKKAAAHHYLTTSMAWLERKNFVNFEGYLKISLKLKPTTLSLIIFMLKMLFGKSLLSKLYIKYRKLSKNFVL